MIFQMFNRTIFLWAAAIAVAVVIINPRAALLQRVNAMSLSSVECLSTGNCDNTKALNEVREYYKILAALYPDYGRGAEMEGICYLALKKDDSAIKKFQEAIAHNPNLFWVSFELGKAYYRKGNYIQALKCFQSIISQDNNELFKKAALSSLRGISDNIREALMLQLVDFVSQVKLWSYQLAIGCLVHRGELAQAKDIINLGANDQRITQHEFFILAQKSLDEDLFRKDMLRYIDPMANSKPVLHPWARFIEPLKEMLYQ